MVTLLVIRAVPGIHRRKGEDDIFPDPASQALADGWHTSPAKALERRNAALVADVLRA